MITADGCFDHPNYCMEFTPRTAGKEARRSDFNYCKLLTHYIKGKSYEEASPEIKHKNAFNQTCQAYSLVRNANQPFASRSTPSTLDTTLAFLDRVLFLCNRTARSSTAPSSRQIWPSSSLVASQRLHGNT